ncbi:hypothetical protein ABEB36_012526 [Hypothenemus hampei]|uniref:Uncharacterized protein n=1 Tax=Hypothenemus hampei TaxID=57062 RepID=A0ABD1EBM1_HYPHA
MNFEDLSDDEDILELVNIELFQNVRTQKVFRIRENHFQKWNDTEFFQRFRLSKNGVRFVLTYIANDIAHPTERNHALSAEMMLVFALRYYATGSFLQKIFAVDLATLIITDGFKKQIKLRFDFTNEH